MTRELRGVQDGQVGPTRSAEQALHCVLCTRAAGSTVHTVCALAVGFGILLRCIKVLHNGMIMAWHNVHPVSCDKIDYLYSLTLGLFFFPLIVHLSLCTLLARLEILPG